MEDSKTYFFFKIPIGMLMNFFEIYGQFGHALSKSFSSLSLDC